jgi:hypothetical protein
MYNEEGGSNTEKSKIWMLPLQTPIENIRDVKVK